MNYQMPLNELIKQIDGEAVSGRLITGMSLDSRRLQPGDLFISLATNPAIRAQHIEQAIASHVAAVCYSAEIPLERIVIEHARAAGIQLVAVNELKDKTSRLAAAFYKFPSQSMTVIAVTGTNGKTSVTQFIAQALENNRQPCGVIGTMGTGRIHDLTFNGMTTPDPVSLQAILAGMLENGIKYVALEASSHALQQGRLQQVEIDYAVLTNLSRDHLDYHQNMEDYAAAKRQLFYFPSLKAVVLNLDDAFGRELLTLMNSRSMETVGYSCQQSDTAFHAMSIHSTATGLQFVLQCKGKFHPIQTRLLGKFNVENLLATAASLSLLGWTDENISQKLEQLTSVNGRMQLLPGSTQPAVVIDFAHTPDALAKALRGMRQHMAETSRLWCVFGCGGDRDAGKRPLMGKVASQLADQVVLTNDNPRSESSRTIIEQILTGCDNKRIIQIEADRQQAIEYAVLQSDRQDMVLIAGKGHEQFQEISGNKLPFNDYEVAMQALQKRTAIELSL